MSRIASDSVQAGLVCLCALIFTGCTGIGGLREQLANHHQLRARRHQQMSDELNARAEAARLQEDAAKAECELEQLAAQNERIDSLRSKLSFGVDQRFVMSDLEVDTDELQSLLAKREKDYQELSELWDRLEKRMLEARNETEFAEAQTRLRALVDQGVAKGCCEPVKNCDVCRKPARRMPELPAKRPVSPVDIPMVIKVRWRVGLDNPQVEEARVRRLQSLPAMSAQQPCPGCDEPSCGINELRQTDYGERRPSDQIDNVDNTHVEQLLPPPMPAPVGHRQTNSMRRS